MKSRLYWRFGMKNLKIYQKISISFLFIIFLTMVLGGLSVKYLNEMKDSIDDMYNHPFTVSTTVLGMKADIIAIHREMKDIAIADTISSINDSEKIVEELETKILSNFDLLEERFLGDKTEIVNFRNSFIGWKEIRDEVIALTRGNDTAAAISITKGTGAERVVEILEYVKYFEEFAFDKAETFHMTAIESARNSLNETMISISIIVVLAVTATFLLARSITNPLMETITVAEHIASGDLSDKLSFLDRKDEIGVLAQSFSNMITSLSSAAEVANKIAMGDLNVNVDIKSEKDIMGNALSKMANSLKEMSILVDRIAMGDLTVKMNPKSENDVVGNALVTMVASLKEVISEIIEGVNILTASSSEIMASTSQVASGAIETASAISETSSTVEQVKQSAQFASEKSKLVSESTQNTVQVSEKGMEAVNKSIGGMTRIQDQVEFIAQSLVRLSEQSQDIGEIITSVNDLAEQSNLLAVNASIEAAKAGEQGKGFAVVAQEVKILAEQSKVATSQVRTILNDILKATNTAVMATEQGTKAVETGVLQSKEAGEAIRQMTEHIDNAAQSALQINVTNQQQLAGMDQITMAMENIQTASSQNLDGTKKVESTVRNLHDLGQRLKQLVDKFKVSL